MLFFVKRKNLSEFFKWIFFFLISIFHENWEKKLNKRNSNKFWSYFCMIRGWHAEIFRRNFGDFHCFKLIDDLEFPWKLISTKFPSFACPSLIIIIFISQKQKKTTNFKLINFPKIFFFIKKNFINFYCDFPSFSEYFKFNNFSSFIFGFTFDLLVFDCTCSFLRISYKLFHSMLNLDFFLNVLWKLGNHNF